MENSRPYPQENPAIGPIRHLEPATGRKDQNMDVIKTETTFEPSLGKAGQGKERLIPIEDYAQKMGVKRSTVDLYAKAGRIETKEQQGRMYVVDKPLVEKEWFELSVVQAQARAQTRWQIACLTFAVLFVLAVIAGAVGGVRLWTDRAASTGMLTTARAQFADTGQLLTALQTQAADAGKQIASLQAQLTAERRDYTAKLESQRTEYAAKIDGLTSAQTQLARAAEQLRTLQTQLETDRQDYKAQLKAQQVSHAATVGQLHDGISQLVGHVVELSKAVAEVELTP